MNPTIDCNVVMLQHIEGVVVSRKSDNQMPLHQNTDWKFRESNYLHKNHVYFTSTEEIKEGDWWFNLSLHRSFPGTSSCRPYNDWDIFSAERLNSDKNVWVKIVAATDPKLGLPLIPNTWIKDKYVPSSGENLIKSVKLEQIEIRGEEEYELISSGEETIKLDCTPGFYTLNITPNNEVVIFTEPERERGIIISFSPYCIGENRDQYKRKLCQCNRCLIKRGEVPDEYTELISQIHSCFNKYELNESTSKIIAKDNEQKQKYAKHDLIDLIQNLQWILEPPTL